MLMDMSSDFNIKKVKRSATLNQVEPHMHPFNEMFYLLSGECTAFIGHNIYKFKRGDFVIVPAGMLHKTNYNGPGVHERVIISFRNDVTDWISSVVGTDIVSECMQTGTISIPEKRQDYVEGLLNKLLYEKNEPDSLSAGFIRVGRVELILFIMRCKKYEENVIKEIDADNILMQEIATYMYEHFSEKITLDDMAKKFSMSRSYLSKKFKASTGFGFKEYLINVRIKNACTLLLQTNKSITDIAFECGFNDSNYFGDAFRHIKGISPNKYRKNKEAI